MIIECSFFFTKCYKIAEDKKLKIEKYKEQKGQKTNELLEKQIEQAHKFEQQKQINKNQTVESNDNQEEHIEPIEINFKSNPGLIFILIKFYQY